MSDFIDIMEDQKKDARIAALEAELAIQRELRRTDNAAGANLDAELRTELAKVRALLDLAVLLLPKDVQVTYSLTTSVDNGAEDSAP